jgi:hypothetical protein
LVVRRCSRWNFGGRRPGAAAASRSRRRWGLCGMSRTRTGLVSVTFSISGILRIVPVGVLTTKWTVDRAALAWDTRTSGPRGMGAFSSSTPRPEALPPQDRSIRSRDRTSSTNVSGQYIETIADRLARPEGTLQPLRPPLFLRPAFPRSHQAERPRPAPAYGSATCRSAGDPARTAQPGSGTNRFSLPVPWSAICATGIRITSARERPAAARPATSSA